MTQEQKILFDRLIEDIQKYGWLKAFSQPLEGLELFFPNKAWDVLNLIFQEVFTELKNADFDPPQKVSERIPAYVVCSLKAAIPYQKVLRKALHTPFLYPRFLTWGLDRLYRLSDLVWKKSGDASLDLSFYTRRWILSTIYIHAFFSFLFDETPEMQLTQKRIFSYTQGWGKAVSFFKSFFKPRS
jgi:ubiquinone biosynthesis protein COQ9